MKIVAVFVVEALFSLQALGIDALRLVPAAIKLIEVAAFVECYRIFVTIFSGGGRSERSKGFDGAAAAGEILTALVWW